MKKIVIVEIKNVYGKEMIYTINSQAKLFVRIAGTKSIPKTIIKDIKLLGFGIVIKPQIL